MICSCCGGQVIWMGPLAALTHTQCQSCGEESCQEPEVQPDEDDGGEG